MKIYKSYFRVYTHNTNFDIITEKHSVISLKYVNKTMRNHFNGSVFPKSLCVYNPITKIDNNEPINRKAKFIGVQEGINKINERYIKVIYDFSVLYEQLFKLPDTIDYIHISRRVHQRPVVEIEEYTLMHEIMQHYFLTDRSEVVSIPMLRTKNV